MSRDKRSVGTAETTCASRTRHSTKLRDILMTDKPNLSYADFHREITKTPDNALPKYVGSQKSEIVEKKNLKEDELVRYMSNLPSYLEKGKNYQEKALNVGVLDWKSLEKWRYSQKQMPHKYSGYSPSSSNTSLFSTDCSSTQSSRGLSCSPASQRVRRLSLQSPLESSPKQGHTQDAQPSSGGGHSGSPVRHRIHAPVPQSRPPKIYAGERMPQEIEVFGANTQKFQDSAVSGGNFLNRQHKVCGAAPLYDRKESHLRSVSEVGKTAAAPWKGKTKIQGTDSRKDARRLPETKLIATDKKCSESERTRVVIRPKDSLEHSCSDFTGSASFTVNDRLSVEPAEKFLIARNNRQGRPVSSGNICNHLEPNASYSQLEGVGKSSHTSRMLVPPTNTLRSPFTVTQGVKAPASPPLVPSFSARMLSSPSKHRHIQENKLVAGHPMEATKSSDESGVRKSVEVIPKARHPSPIRRLSFAMGKMIKNAGGRDSSPLRRLSSKDCVAKSVSETVGCTLSSENPSSDKVVTSSNNNRGRSSPLRRLLDPLLKPRASHCSEPSKKHSSYVAGTIKPSTEPSDCRPGHSCEVNLRSAIATTSASAHHYPKNGSSTLQALLQVSFKNGLPLFTFAIDNESNILAATVRKSSVPGKAHHCWTYTFFTIREVKRKSGNWLNHGGKGDGHGYIPNVVAQMKVSDSCSASFINCDNAGDHITREFDLFAVDVGHGDECSTDFHPTNELAAIITKLPKAASRNYCEDDQSSYNWLDLSQAPVRENSQVTRIHSVSPGEVSENQHSFSSLISSLISSSTVILPGGVHTVPSKGEVSRLAQRWRSGGLCDCGGWDLGCQLRVYTSKKDADTKFAASGIYQNRDVFEVFSQVGQDNQPAVSLAPFKERIYSVEFNSSLSLLQAFAVSISFIDCRRSPELSESGNVAEKGSDGVGIYEIQSKTSSQAEAPGKYVSYPPHSPVGRV